MAFTFTLLLVTKKCPIWTLIYEPLTNYETQLNVTIKHYDP